ncbi:MAG: carboxypeptidase-like regulatory domain-containing protein [Pirellulaceae bacterium]
MTNVFCKSAAVASVLLLAGCGGGTPSNVGVVSGVVTLDGQPLPDAIVTFTPAGTGSVVRATTDAAGKYQLVYSPDVYGAEIGEYKVAISSYQTGDPDADPPKPKVPEKVPAKYNVKSELSAKVNAGENVLDFELKKDGPIIQPEQVQKQEDAQERRRTSC